MKTILWLDDIRDPFSPAFREKREQCLSAFTKGVRRSQIVWVKSYDEFREWIEKNGLPVALCLDHDLGEDVPSGKDAMNFVIEYCLDNEELVPPTNSQSDNPAGKKNILSLWSNFLMHQVLDKK